MTTKDLKKYFKSHLVPGKLYDLKGARKNKLCLEHVKDGWNVFFADQKEKVGLLHFQTEAAACEALKEQVDKVMQALYGVRFA